MRADVLLMVRPAVARDKVVDDTTLRRLIGYRLKRAFNVLRTDLGETLEPLGLRMITYSALVLITDNPGLRPSRLAKALVIERPNMVAVLDELEEQGLIRRARDPNDRRAHTLTATPEGRRLCARAIAKDQRHEAVLLAGASAEDLAIVERVLDQIEQRGQG